VGFTGEVKEKINLLGGSAAHLASWTNGFAEFPIILSDTKLNIFTSALLRTNVDVLLQETPELPPWAGLKSLLDRSSAVYHCIVTRDLPTTGLAQSESFNSRSGQELYLYSIELNWF
jgi:hypothetical protein